MNFSMRAQSSCLPEIMLKIGKMARVPMSIEVLVIPVFRPIYIIAETLTIILVHHV